MPVLQPPRRGNRLANATDCTPGRAATRGSRSCKNWLLWAERWWPRWFFRLMLMAGTWVGVALMPAQRADSRAYLSVVLGRPPGLQDVWRHFFAFADFLVLKLRTGRGAAVRCVLEPENKEAFEALLDSGQPALFGTFHFGASDLLGYQTGRAAGGERG